MPIKWTESATVKLVFLYGRYECLRNPFHPDFNKQLCCYRAYKQIAELMNIPGLTACDCVKRITFVKKQYCFELSKISEAISRGQFYRPTASWFEMMHELLFPYMESQFDSSENLMKGCSCVQDYELRSNEYDVENSLVEDCECPPCDCPPCEEPRIDVDAFSILSHPNRHRPKSRGTKFRPKSKSPSSSSMIGPGTRESRADSKHVRLSSKCNRQSKTSTQTEQDFHEKICCDRGTKPIESQSSTQWAQTDVKRLDLGNRIGKSCLQIGAQTDKKFLSNACTSCAVLSQKEESTQNSGRLMKDAFADAIDDRAVKCRDDEFEMFGKSIACQLRSLSLESAISLEKRIQDMMSEERLVSMKEKSKSESCGKEVIGYDWKDCCSSGKEEMCTCGLPINKCLPVITVNGSRCCSFCCN